MKSTPPASPGPSTATASPWRAGVPSPTEIPPIALAERRLADGEYSRAVADGFHRVVLDVQKAYGLSLPAQWTHRQFLAEFLRPDMGILTEKVVRLYRVYEPVRYGTESDWVRADLIALLQDVYAEPPMRDLYRKAKPPATYSVSPDTDRSDRSRDYAPPGLR
jgi:hypothetical protein